MKTFLSLLAALFVLSIGPAHAFNMFGGAEQFRIATTPPFTWVWDNKLGKAVPGPAPTEEDILEGYESSNESEGEGNDD